ncbi:DUF1622 domain-containing protein, partial [Streptomyces sp. NPDC002054]|uniref:DUF1622 domain-containing protein n=1 Tax=Streptomyces sp. NPDC002054 TaxID=3154663 RepID=UPI003322BA47
MPAGATRRGALPAAPGARAGPGGAGGVRGAAPQTGPRRVGRSPRGGGPGRRSTRNGVRQSRLSGAQPWEQTRHSRGWSGPAEPGARGAAPRQHRLDLGRFIALGLEFQLAADVLRTAVAPTFTE